MNMEDGINKIDSLRILSWAVIKFLSELQADSEPQFSQENPIKISLEDQKLGNNPFRDKPSIAIPSKSSE